LAVPGAFETAFPPELVERFEIERPLGEGGMGTVYLARDRDVQAPVAIKLLQDPGQEHLVKRFLRECEILADMDHPGVVHVYEYGVTSGGPFLVMPFIPGQSLDQVTELENPDEVLFLLADAIQAIHDKNIVHRDIKPANVMINRDDEPVLIDFGVVYAAELSRLTQTGGVAGTMAFLSPELLRGRKATPASDWYAWAVSSYLVVEGVAPYTPSDLFSAAADGALPPPPLHRLRKFPGLAKAILGCLRYHPESRPANRVALGALAEGATEDDLPAAGENFHRIAAATPAGSSDPVARRFYEDGLDKARRGDLAGARTELQRALAYDEGDPAIWREMGIVLALDGRWDAALEAADRAVAASPDEGRTDAELQRLRAFAQERCGREAAAAASFRRFLDVCPEDSFVTAREVAEQKLQACEADAEKVANTFVPIPLEESVPGGYSQPPDGAAVAGEAASRTSPPADMPVDRYWEELPLEVPRCAPPSPPRGGGGEADGLYRQALQAWARGDFLEAENSLRKLALYHTDFTAGTRELGLFLVDRGEYQAALLPLRDTMAKNPDDFEVLRFLALSFEQLHRDEDARDMYRRFLEQAPASATRPRAHAERRLEALERAAEAVAAIPPTRGEMQEVPGTSSGGGAKVFGFLLLVALGAGGWVATNMEQAPTPAPTVEPLVDEGSRVSVPLSFVGNVARLLPRVGGDKGLAAKLGQFGKDAAADGAFDAAVPEGDLREAMATLMDTDEPKALAPLWELLDYPEGDTREFAQVLLLDCPTRACAGVLQAWALRTSESTEGKEFQTALGGLLAHPHPEAPEVAVTLLVRLLQASDRSNSIAARDSYEEVLRALRFADPERYVPAVEAALERFSGDEAVVEELTALRKVLQG
jgi:tetratricopeptide (TPR) repeat protein/predicted Ser/Thr protein kinase